MGPLLNLQALAPHQVLQAREHVKSLARDAGSRVEAAERMVSYLYEHCRDATGTRTTVLVRCFQTCVYARLPVEYQLAADRMTRDLVHASPQMRCLSLLATRGKKLTWNDPATSTGHMAIPLPSVEVVVRAPMIARLFESLGVKAEHVVSHSAPEMQDGDDGEGKFFHVAEAEGSPFLPAQDSFVRAHGVRSVVGLGGALRDGEYFAVLLFASVPINEATARSLAEIMPGMQAALEMGGERGLFVERIRH